MSISFFVPGVPVAKGSTKAFWNKKAAKIVTVATNAEKQKPWASLIALKAQECGVVCTEKAVSIAIDFYFRHPKSHYNSKGVLKPGARLDHTVKPDLDKLLRCVLDALTSVAWNDDSQVVQCTCTKRYLSLHVPSPFGAFIRIE